MPFSGLGAGTTIDPYQITTLAQLYEIFDDLTAEYLLMNDIDASDTSSGLGTQPWNGAAGWQPVDGAVFSGVLDGGGFTITNLYIDLAVVSHHGGLLQILSGEVKNLKVVYNLSLDTSSGTNYKKFGGICYDISSGIINACDTEIVTTGGQVFNIGGIATTASNGGFSISNSSSKIDLEIDGGGNINSVAGTLCTFQEEGSILDCSSQLRINQTASTAYTARIGGIVSRYTTGIGTYAIERCKANVSIYTHPESNSIGGIIGEMSNTSGDFGESIKSCWAYGTISGGYNLGGLIGKCEGKGFTHSWAKVDIISQVSGGDVRSGLLAGGQSSTQNTEYESSFSYGSMSIINQPATNYSADVTINTGLFSDVFFREENLGDITIGAAGDLTYGAGLTDAELTDAGNIATNTFADFSTYFQLGGYNGFPDIIGNLYDPSFIIYEAEIYIAVTAGTNYVNSTAVQITGGFSGVNETDLDSKGFVWGTATGVYGDSQVLNPTDSFIAQVDNLTELDTIYFKSYVVYNGETTYSAEQEYVHYAVNQLPIDPIVVEDWVTTTGSHNIHGSVLVDVSGVDYVFGSPREHGINADNTDVNAKIIKVRADDYSDYTSLEIFDEDGSLMNAFNQISYCNGFVWTIGKTAINNPVTPVPLHTYIVRINPTTMEYVCFTGEGMSLSIDSHGADNRYLYTGGRDITKIDTNELLDSYPSASYQVINTAVVGSYDNESQGYALNIDAPVNWNHLTKGYIHSYVVSGEYLFACYTTGSSVDSATLEPECELHKIKKSDMSGGGYARIPKSTDDATQNADYVFLGVEIDGNTWTDGNPSLVYGHDFGCFAIRKSDMTCFALKRLHKTDLPGTSSYASTVFGQYLIDQKVSRVSYVVDISNVEAWSQIDQFATPGNWGLGGSIGDHLVKVFKLYKSYVSPSDNAEFYLVHNEIMFDSNLKFHSFFWSSSTNGSPSELGRYSVSGISFLGAAIVDTFVPQQSADDWLLTGSVINENGATVTAIGFEYSKDNTFTTGVTNINASVGNFTGTIINPDAGTWYVRAWADNTEGRGYGDVVSFTIDADYSMYSLSGNVTIEGAPVENATVLLISQLTSQVVATTATDAQGDYSFTDRSPDNDYVIVVYYTDGTTKFTSVAKPYKRFTL